MGISRPLKIVPSISNSVDPDHMWANFSLIIVMDGDLADFIFKFDPKNANGKFMEFL